MQIDPVILTFVREHHVLTLATALNDIPSCCSCFYVFREETAEFVFKSDAATRHAEEILKNPVTAANIHVETETIGEIKGLQIRGRARRLDENDADAIGLYNRRFPYAADSPGSYWSLRAAYFKMTDNSVQFGYKRIWNDTGD